MAQLYEKLRAQDDDVNIAWLAQFSPEEKPDTLSIDGRLPSDDHGNDAVSIDSSDDDLSSDSESEAEPFNLGLNFDYPTCTQPS